MLKLGLVVGIGGLMVMIVLSSICIIKCKRRRKRASSNLHSNSSKSDMEVGSVYLGARIFSYNQLAEATDHFSHHKRLGDGGYGTVYYGNKLSFFFLFLLNIKFSPPTNGKSNARNFYIIINPSNFHPIKFYSI